MTIKEKTSLKTIFKRAFQNFGCFGGSLGLLVGLAGTIATAGFTGIPFLGISAVGASIGTTIGITKLGIIVAGILTCAATSILPPVIFGLIVGTLIGVGCLLVKRHYDSKKQEALQSNQLTASSGKVSNNDRSFMSTVFKALGINHKTTVLAEPVKTPTPTSTAIVNEYKDGANVPAQTPGFKR